MHKMSKWFHVAVAACGLSMFQFGYNLSSLNTPQTKVEQFLVDTFKQRYNVTLSQSDSR